MNKLQPYLDNKLLRKSSLGDVDIYCYTSNCFWDKDSWDDITKSHRGRIYYKGKSVNCPLPKIFNIGEQPETALDVIEHKMATIPYTIMDKANGHLFMASVYDVEGELHVTYHTKGSLPVEGNDLLNNDIALFKQYIEEKLLSVGNKIRNLTLMFEAIVEHDKHTLYENQVATYGNNQFVLLAGSYLTPDGWRFFDRVNLKALSMMLGCPIVKVYNPEELPISLNNWYTSTGVEGYVIRFEDGSYVKIKTKEYWLLRSKNDLSADRIMQIFRGGGFDRMEHKLPEELALSLKKTLLKYFKGWYLYDYVDISCREVERYFEMDVSREALRKIVSGATDLTERQKTYLYDCISDKERDYTKSKHIRKKFIRCYESSKSLRQGLQDAIRLDIIRLFE